MVNDEIQLVQDKTDVPLAIPLTAIVGNAIYDYIVSEHPENEDRHIFLGENRHHFALTFLKLEYMGSSKLFSKPSRTLDTQYIHYYAMFITDRMKKAPLLQFEIIVAKKQ